MDIYEETLSRLPGGLREKLDPPPPQGNLNLEGVLTSDFFFS
jgi:DNA-directed RNA polymerase